MNVTLINYLNWNILCDAIDNIRLRKIRDLQDRLANGCRLKSRSSLWGPLFSPVGRRECWKDGDPEDNFLPYARWPYYEPPKLSRRLRAKYRTRLLNLERLNRFDQHGTSGGYGIHGKRPNCPSREGFFSLLTEVMCNGHAYLCMYILQLFLASRYMRYFRLRSRHTCRYNIPVECTSTDHNDTISGQAFMHDLDFESPVGGCYVGVEGDLRSNYVPARALIAFFHEQLTLLNIPHRSYDVNLVQNTAELYEMIDADTNEFVRYTDGAVTHRRSFGLTYITYLAYGYKVQFPDWDLNDVFAMQMSTRVTYITHRNANGVCACTQNRTDLWFKNLKLGVPSDNAQQASVHHRFRLATLRSILEKAESDYIANDRAIDKTNLSGEENQRPI